VRTLSVKEYISNENPIEPYRGMSVAMSQINEVTVHIRPEILHEEGYKSLAMIP
jgi:hypothetical protein